MLILSRKPSQKLLVGCDITVTVLKIRGNQVRIGIEAPARIPIVRSELCASSEVPFTGTADRSVRNHDANQPA